MPLWLPCAGQPAPCAHAANMPRPLGALTKKPASPFRLLCTWVADSNTKAEERPGQPGKAGLIPSPLPVRFCQMQYLCWALGFCWLSPRVFSAEYSEHANAGGWERVSSGGSHGRPWHTAPSHGSAAEPSGSTATDVPPPSKRLS